MSAYSFRITTNGVLRNYRSNLYKSYNTLNTAMTRLQTHREYNSYAEDPTSANTAFQLRRSIWRTNDQLNNTNNTIGIYDTAYTAMDSICDGNDSRPGFDAIKEKLEVLNGPTGDGRVPLGQTLLSTAESIVQVMNSQYAGNFVFAGADGHNVPFTWEETEDGSKVLLYRGVNVNTPNPELVNQFTEEIHAEEMAAKPNAKPSESNVETQDILNEAGDTVIGKRTITYTKDDATDPLSDTVVTTKEEYYKLDGDNKPKQKVDANGDKVVDADGKPVYEVDPAQNKDPEETRVQSSAKAFEEKYGVSLEQATKDYEKMQKMLGEHTYVDIGLGFKEENGEVVPTSAYDTCLHGPEILGWGVDEDGDPKNIVSLMWELGKIAQRCNAEDGKFAPGDEERANVLCDKLKTSLDKVSEQHVKLTAETKYLYSNVEILTNARDALDSQRAEIEQVKPALAIEEMSWANYAYNAALKIGNTILSQSLIDYMS